MGLFLGLHKNSCNLIFNKTDKEWLSNFLVESVEIVKPVEQFQQENFDESNGTMSNSVISVLPTNDNLL